MQRFGSALNLNISLRLLILNGMYAPRVERLVREAKILQIYAGIDEIQVVAIARELLSGGYMLRVQYYLVLEEAGCQRTSRD